MSRVNLVKKLRHLRMAWKSAQKTMRSNIEKISISQSIRKMARLSRKNFAITNCSPSTNRGFSSNLAISDKYEAKSGDLEHKELEKQYGKVFENGDFSRKINKNEPGKVPLVEPISLDQSLLHETNTMTEVDAWETALVPKIDNIDQKAEEFISKFREEMKLQKDNYDRLETNENASLNKVSSIDEKAEEFISQFRKELKQQKERSDLETNVITLADAWEIFSIRTEPDQKAEQFISKFRDDLKLQNERFVNQASGIAAVNALENVKLSKVHSIDEKADEFISKFRKELKLQKERSNHDFEEMLARGVK